MSGPWGGDPTAGPDEIGDAGVPDVLQNLGEEAKKLLKDPRTYVIGILIEWLVGGILDFAESIVALILEAFMLAAGIPGNIGTSFGSAGAVISGSVFGVFGTLTEMGVGLLEGLGWTAPIVAAIVFYALLETTEEFGPAVLAAVSDLLGAIPVVGSILDAGLTLLLRLGAVIGGDDS
jgi:hypothetical protein